jgi:hypothetical protein
VAQPSPAQGPGTFALRFRLSDDRAITEARYSNHLEIGQNAFEILLDFGQLYNGNDREPRIHTRIITSPFYAKQFSRLLQESISRYEENNGSIPNEEP